MPFFKLRLEHSHLDDDGYKHVESVGGRDCCVHEDGVCDSVVESVLEDLPPVRDIPRLAHVVSVLFNLHFVPYPKLFVEVGEVVSKGSVRVGNDGCIVPSPVFVGKDGEETIGECLVHVHALCIVLLVGLPCLADDGIGDSGAIIVVRWRSPWICCGGWVEVGRITGVLLPNVVWDSWNTGQIGRASCVP